MEKQNRKERDKRKPRYLRNFCIYLHYVSMIAYTFAPCTIYSESFFSKKPIFYLFMNSLLYIAMHFYKESCGYPGYQTEEPAKTDGLFYSQDALMHCQVRACYCRECKRIILRRDHHCPWTSNCIGRDNNLAFLYYTVFETLMGFFILLDAIRAIYICWFEERIYFKSILTMFMGGVGLFDEVFVGGLIYQNFRNAMKNVTVWENRCRESITYLKEYPPWSSPFNKGWKENLKEFFTMKEKKMEWPLPGRPSLEDFKPPQEFLDMMEREQNKKDHHHHHTH